MTESSLTDDLRNGPAPADDLDRLLSGFFKSQMRTPWPAAPAVAASEPSVLVAARTAAAEVPRNQPTPAHDPGSKARYTLATSVALLLGTCWYLTGDFQPGQRPGAGPDAKPNMLGGAGASNPKALEELRPDKAKTGDPKVGIPKIELP